MVCNERHWIHNFSWFALFNDEKCVSTMYLKMDYEGYVMWCNSVVLSLLIIDSNLTFK